MQLVVSVGLRQSREINFWLCLINIAPDPGSGCGCGLYLVLSSDRFRFAFTFATLKEGFSSDSVWAIFCDFHN